MIARIKGWLAALGLAITVAVAAWFKGRSQGKTDAQAREDAAYRETRRRMDNVSIDDLDDADVADRLRQHAGKPDRDL